MAFLHKKNDRYYCIDKSYKPPRWIALGSTSHLTHSRAKIIVARYNADKTYLRLDIIEDSKITFTEMVEEYLDHAGITKAKSSVKCERHILEHLQKKFGKRNIGGIKASEYEDFFRTKDYKQNTIRLKVTALRELYRLAIERRYIKKDISRQLKIPKKEKLAPRHLSPEAIQQIIEHAGNGARDYLSIMYYTGLRPSDVMRLHTSDINIKGRVIRAKMGKKRDEVIILPIHSKILPIIKRRASGGFLFPNRAGGHQTSWRTGLKYACERAGIDATAYQFRHSFGTHLLAKTGNIRLVQQLMGHSSITMTTRYATALDEALTEAVEAL